MPISDDCASNLHDYCGPCDCSCHGENLTLEELKALARLLNNHYIPYDDLAAHDVVDKIMKIVNSDDK